MTTSTLFSQPASPTVDGSGTGNNGTTGLHFTVSAAGTLAGIWHFSPATSTQLPVTIGLYTTQASPATGTLVTSQAATWSGAPGSGWVFAAFTTPPSLVSGTQYMAVQFRNDTTNEWFVFDSTFTWPASGGVITAPKDTGTGQGWFNTGTTLTFPSSQLAGTNWWMDVSVVSGGGPVTVALPVAQATTTAHPPGTSAGPVALPAAQVTEAAFPPVPVSGTTVVLPAAQVTAAGQRLSPVFSGAAALLPAQVAAAAQPVIGSTSVVIPLLPAQAGAAAGTVTPSAAVPLHVAQVTPAGHLLAPPVSMVTVAGTWTGSHSVAAGFFFPFPTARPLQIAVTNTAGDWLFAVIAWRPGATGADVSVCVADDAHNWWEPVGAPSTDSGAAGAVRTAVWAAPAARVANTVTGVTNVQVAPTGPVLSLACTIADMNGLLPWYQVAAIDTSFANAVTSLSVSAPAPADRALLFAGFATDDNSKTITGPAGWTALPVASATNGTDHTTDVKITPAFQVATTSASASVTSSGALDLAGVIAGVLVSAPQPVQPNPNWPVMVTEAAIGSGVQTPPSEMTWTPLSGRSLSLTVTQGKQYSLSQLQAGQGTLLLDDPDGAFIPPGTGAFAGIDSGTPLRRRVTWPGPSLTGQPILDTAGSQVLDTTGRPVLDTTRSPNPTPHYVAFSGYVRRWPWNMDTDLYRGQVQAELTDIWGYGNGVLNAMAIQESLLDSPNSLWALTDPPGSTGSGNLVPNGPPLNLTVSKYGTGDAVATFGANSGALLGMSSSQVTTSGKEGGASGMFQQTLSQNSLSTAGFGFALVASSTSFPAVSSGVTVEAFAQLQLGAGFISFTAPVGTAIAVSSSLAPGQAVIPTVASGFTFPTGLTAGNVYFVVGQGGTSVQLATTPGGTPVSITVAGFGFLMPTVPWNPVILATRALGVPVAGLEVDHLTGALTLRYRPANATTDTTVVVDSSRDYRNSALLTHFSLSFNQTTWRVLTDGGQFVTASGTFSSPLPATFTGADFGGVMDRGSQGLVWTGFLGGPVGIYPGISAQVRVINRFEAAFFGLTNEAACDRVERLLEYAGLTGRRWIGQQQVAFEGDLVVSGQDIGGQAAVSSINNITASTAPALAYIAPTGDTVYRSKLYVWNEPVRWTLGDDTAAGEIPFQVGIATDYDPSRVTAQVQLTQLDTQAVTAPAGIMAATTMAAVAATAAGQYGGTPYQNTGYLELDWSAADNAGGSLVDLANWVQAVFARPANRVAAVTVNAAAFPAAWPFWAGASVGDMVQVNLRLPTAATSPLISLVARITQTARSSQFSQDSTSATITATLDFAPEFNALTCDDPVRGLLDGSTSVMPW